MGKATRIGIHTCRAICALLTVLWTLSLFNVFGSAFAHPDYFKVHWLRYVFAVLVVFVPAWGYIKLTEVVARSKARDKAAHESSAQATASKEPALNSPAKRICFILMVAGICLCVATFVVFQMQRGHSFVSFGDALFNRPHGYISYKIFMWLGVIAAVVGLLGSLLYNVLFSKLVYWVRHGSSASP